MEDAAEDEGLGDARATAADEAEAADAAAAGRDMKDEDEVDPLTAAGGGEGRAGNSAELGGDDM